MGSIARAVFRSLNLAALLAAAEVMAVATSARAQGKFGLLGGGQRDGGWDGAGRPRSRALAATVIPFLDAATPMGP